MKRDTGILLAGSLGVLIGIGLFGLRQFLKKKSREYDEYYTDFHRHFVIPPKDEANDGIELLAVR